jgi:hypothetical protein
VLLRIGAHQSDEKVPHRRILHRLQLLGEVIKVTGVLPLESEEPVGQRDDLLALVFGQPSDRYRRDWRPVDAELCLRLNWFRPSR